MKREYRKPLFRKIYVTFVAIAFSVLGVFLAFGLSALRSFYYDNTRSALEARGKLISGEMISLIRKRDMAEIQRRVTRLGHESGTRFTVILPSGMVAGDSEKNPSTMDNHGDRPEIVQALRDNAGSSVRHSHTLDEDHMYLALPLRAEDGAPIGVIRASLPLTAVHAALWRIYTRMFFGALVLLVLTAVVSWRISTTISDPLERMKSLAERIAQGDFAARMKMERTDALEIERTGRAMNKISIQLAHRIQTILEQKAEQEAVFSSMIEGVIAIDAERRIMHVNAAAEQAFGLNRETDIGRPLHEIVRMTDLHEVADRAISSSEPVESELTIRGAGERFIQVHGTALIGARGDHSGAVLVFNDVTRLRALENHRRDFVSNVSHELRTPLTSIQGFVETLLDGAYKSPEECLRFLTIIQRQAGRLAAIVEDLLDLSKIEAQSDRKEVPLTVQPIKPLLVAVMEVCGPKAVAKRISVELSCPEGLKAPVNAPLFEQAVINLVDNAVKYSEEARTVRVEASEREGWVSVRVADEGVGIPREHLARIFERFYRVDKARSRMAGGTGLGLAIVKHIALAHHGMARVESEPGKGSSFVLDLPKTINLI